MKVSITYHDTGSLTVEEVVRQAAHNYGKHVHVEVTPESTKPHDLIYFGIQNIVSHKQFSAMFDKSLDYQQQLQKLRGETLYKLQEILDQVLIDNESKVGS